MCLFPILALFAAIPIGANPLGFIRVIDAKTFDVSGASAWFYGIDAVELGQTCCLTQAGGVRRQ
jgi:endonuclease YncB( thermonuclease family)